MHVREENLTASGIYIHPTAEVSPQAELGPGTRVWHHAQVREGARPGSHCIPEYLYQSLWNPGPSQNHGSQASVNSTGS